LYSSWSQPLVVLNTKEPTIDYCRHDDVDLDANENFHAISCNQCRRWWDCYGQFADVWANFIKFNRMDGSEPPTVNIVGSPKEWPTSDKKTVEAVYIRVG
jgi:hypothetical protein